MNGIVKPASLAAGLAAIAALLYALFVLGTAGAQEPADPSADPSAGPEPGQITVVAAASASVAPDEALLGISLSATRAGVIEAIGDTNVATAAVIAALLDAGITADDLATTRISLQPQYEFTSGARKLIGFRFTNSIRVTVQAIDTVGNVIDSAVGAGGDLITVDWITFQVSDPSAIEDEVRLVAIDKAIEKATAMTERADVTLGRAISIREVGFASPVLVGERSLALDEGLAAPTPVFTGSQDVTVTVEIVFETF